jgi:FixJ family two-component response regulator
VKRTGELVYLVDDDQETREQLLRFLSSIEIETIGFSSAAEFLAENRPDACSCLIVAMDMKEMSGLELQRRLDPRAHPPIIFLDGLSSVASTVAAMKAGAIEFLTRPINTSVLQTAIESALMQNRVLRQKRARRAQLQEKLSLLTPRQREVLPLVIGGLLNKQAAALLHISEVTLQIHRSQIMQKMAANSLADLVRMAVELRIPYWKGRSEMPELRGPSNQHSAGT